jgi:hypothetical protein
MGMAEAERGNGRHRHGCWASQSIQTRLCSQVVAEGAPAGPASGVSKRVEVNPGALAPVVVSLHSHGGPSRTKHRGAGGLEEWREWRKGWRDDALRCLSREPANLIATDNLAGQPGQMPSMLRRYTPVTRREKEPVLRPLLAARAHDGHASSMSVSLPLEEAWRCPGLRHD